MDILPAIPDDERLDDSILITDRKLREWQHSNPKGFADWFYGRMAGALLDAKQTYALEARASIEDVPDWQVKTPLQRVVQILKRHRDLYFQNDTDNCPASIIITTLAAHAYRDERTFEDALDSILQGMTSSTHLYQDENGDWVLENPVNGEENFCDRWQGYPNRAKRFFEWVVALKRDMDWLSEEQGLDHLAKYMERTFGQRFTNSAIVAYGEKARTDRQRGQLRVESGTGMLGAVGTVIPKHNFYGP